MSDDKKVCRVHDILYEWEGECPECFPKGTILCLTCKKPASDESPLMTFDGLDFAHFSCLRDAATKTG